MRTMLALAAASFALGARGAIVRDADADAQAALQASKSSIPWQLVLTAKSEHFEEMDPKVQENIRRTLALNPGIKMRWLGDASCREYIEANHGAKLLKAFDGERRGNYRGDICRAAVLALEGGFYADLDVQPVVSFSQMVDENTTFMAAVSNDKALLNALLATEPKGKVMREVVAAIEDWYGGHGKDDAADGTPANCIWMGPITLLRGLRQVTSKRCPSVDVRNTETLQWACGPHQQVRIYQEKTLNCPGRTGLRGAAERTSAQDPETECPPERSQSNFEGLHFGIFEPGPLRKLVAWPRFAACGAYGCGSGGWDSS